MLERSTGNDYQLIRHPFLTTPEMQEQDFSFAGHNYMSILTDGKIDPEQNYRYDNYPLWFYRFTNKDKIYLVDNEIRNLQLPVFDLKTNKNFIQSQLRMTYRTPLPDSFTTEHGFNNWYLMFSENTIDFEYTLHNPHWFVDFSVPALSEVNYWFGIRRPVLPPVITPTLAIPYLPFTYDKIRICLKLTGGTTTVKWNQYFWTGNTVCKTDTLMQGCQEINCCSNRHSINLDNRAPINPTAVHINVSFIKRTV